VGTNTSISDDYCAQAFQMNFSASLHLKEEPQSAVYLHIQRKGSVWREDKLLLKQATPLGLCGQPFTF